VVVDVVLASKRGCGFVLKNNQPKPTRAEPYLAAYFGLKEAMVTLLENRHNLNSKDSNGQPPLSWAAWSGHAAVVKLLLEKGAKKLQ
jgi:ankyrin repeat protein